MENVEVALIVAVVLIILWLYYNQTKKEGIDVRALARPIAGGYSTESKVLGRTWTATP